MSDLGVSIKDITQERAWIKNDIFSVEDIVVCETKDSEHATHMFSELKKRYEHINMSGNEAISSGT